MLPPFSHFHTLAKLNKLTKNRGNYYKQKSAHVSR
nr:MAG TPA: hypothetical protein [Caudoviricetes sp.]DAV26763.1 MAG TPA: hypothetical protein [Caudoviricetes sp.]